MSRTTYWIFVSKNWTCELLHCVTPNSNMHSLRSSTFPETVGFGAWFHVAILGIEVALSWVLGPLHTRAKSHDHEIVRAQKGVSKGRPKTPPNYVVWSWTLKCSVKSYMTGPSTKRDFNEISIHPGPHTWQNRTNQRLWAFGVPWSPDVVSGLPPRGGFQKQSKWPWNLFHSRLCKNPCRLHIHLAPHTLHWSLKHSVK